MKEQNDKIDITEVTNKIISRRSALKYAAAVGALGILESCKRKANIYKADNGESMDTAIMASRFDNKNGNNKVSLLGFGCMRFPVLTPGEPDIDEEMSTKMIDYAYSKGVNYYDTAYPYHRGLSETFIGKALKKYPRESFYLADKMPTWMVSDKGEAKTIFEEQLSKCQVDYFDYYLCHSLGNKDTYQKVYEDGGVYDYLVQEKAEGRIKRLGFSFHGDLELMQYLIDLHDWDFVQIQLNYFDWNDPEQNSGKLYEMLSERQIPIIIMEPIRGGALATLNNGCKKMLTDENPDVSAASWALRFAGSLPGVLTVLSGMSTFEQVVENVNTFSHFTPITERERSLLFKVAEAFRDNYPIPCTSCSYCMPCPYGVNIPNVFAAYNKCATELNIPDFDAPIDKDYKKKRKIFIDTYSRALLPEERADKCVACKKCKTKCPQHIQIWDEMEKITKIYNTLI